MEIMFFIINEISRRVGGTCTAFSGLDLVLRDEGRNNDCCEEDQHEDPLTVTLWRISQSLGIYIH